MDQNVLAGYAAVALALILDLSGGLFSDAARPCQRPAPPPLAQTWHSKIEIRDQNGVVAPLWLRAKSASCAG